MNRAVGTLIAVFVLLGICAVARAQSADGFNPGANNGVDTLAVQPDGKVLVGGAFTILGGGGTGTTPRNYLGRLNADGSLDASFNPGANGEVYALTVQPDGKIVVGGAFTMLGGGGTGTTSRNYLGRLNADGSLDASFNPGANGAVYGVAVQVDGKILVTGGFHTLGGGGTGTTARGIPRAAQRRRLARHHIRSGRDLLCLRRGGAAGREDPGRRMVHYARWRRDRHDASQLLRATQRRRLARRELQSGREQLRQHSGGAAGREDSGWWQLHDAGRRRDRHDDAQPSWAAHCRRLARHHFQSGRERRRRGL
jgi:uncharacterized delta-60 repeat protein